MGRPWWYADYGKKGRPAQRQLLLQKRQFWAWTVLMAFSLFLTASNTGFRFNVLVWIVLFVSNFCQLLIFAVILRAVLSWTAVSRANIFIASFNDVTEPILSPLRRTVPRVGMFDISPIIAIIILYCIPMIVNFLLNLFA
jgi:YggT family protein